MKLGAAAVFLALASPAALAFAPTTTSSSSQQASMLRAVAVEEELEREQPGAGYMPEWENRPGLPEEEFIKSDMSKPDLSGMWECPLTKWDSDG